MPAASPPAPAPPTPAPPTSADGPATGHPAGHGAAPVPPITALDGKTTVDATFGRLEALILAHHAVESIARVAGTALGEAHGHAPPPRAYVIAQPGDAQALLAYRVFRLQVHELSEAYRALNTALNTAPSPSVPAAPNDRTLGIDDPVPPTSARAEIAKRVGTAAAAITGVANGIAPTLVAATLAVQAAASLVSYLRTETTITGQDVAVNEAMFVSELRAHLRPDVRLYYPGLLPIGLADRVHPDGTSTDGHGAATGDLIGDPVDHVTHQLRMLRTQETHVRDALDHGASNVDARAELAELQAQRAKLEAWVLFGDDPQREQPSGPSSPVQPKPDAAPPATPPPDAPAALATLAHGAALEHLLHAQALLLYVRIQHASGSTRIERNLLWWRSRLSASGGAVITLLAFDGTGALRLARTLSASTGYRTFPARAAAANAFDVGHWTPHDPPHPPRARWWEFWAWWDDA